MLMLFPFICMWGADEPNSMLVKMKNGTTMTYSFADLPKVKITGDVLEITSDKYTVNHAIKEVQRYTFYYDPSGVEDIMKDNEVSHDGDMISVKSSKTGEVLSVYNTVGALVASAKTDANGDCSLSLVSLPTGVYVVTFQGSSSKIIKR